MIDMIMNFPFRQTAICWTKPSIPHFPVKEHLDRVNLCIFLRMCVHTPQEFQRGLTPWHTDFGTKPSVLHLSRGGKVLPGTRVRSDCPQTRQIAQKAGHHRHGDTLPLVVAVRGQRSDICWISIVLLLGRAVPQTLLLRLR